MQKRHVLIAKVKIVSGRKLYLEGVIFRTAGAASYMINQGSGAVHVLVAINPGPVSDINILQISKMILIKIANAGEGRPAIDGSAGAGRKNFLRLCKIGYQRAVAPADPPAQDGIEVSGTVNEVRVIHLDHLAADRKNLWGLFNGLYHLFYIVWIHSGVVVKKDHVGGPGFFDSYIDCLAKTIIFF